MKREEIIDALEHVSEKLKVKKIIKNEQGYMICPICKIQLPYQFQRVNCMKYCINCGQRIEV